MKPSLTPDGRTLILPLNGDPHYDYWRPCGRSLVTTLRELGASQEVQDDYSMDFQRGAGITLGRDDA